MKVTVIEDAQVLIPNKQHQSFVHNSECIKKGTEIEGTPKKINGLRKGEPFTYKLFEIGQNKFIFLNKINAMENTVEVNLNADGQVSPTEVNLKPAENFSRVKMTGLILGGIAGFAYSKYRKHDKTKYALCISVGAAAGYAIGVLVDINNDITIRKSN